MRAAAFVADWGQAESDPMADWTINKYDPLQSFGALNVPIVRSKYDPLQVGDGVPFPGRCLDVPACAWPPMGTLAVHLCGPFQLELALLTQQWSSSVDRKLLGYWGGWVIAVFARCRRLAMAITLKATLQPVTVKCQKA